MEYINKMELTIARWYSKLPSLSAEANRRIADNLWWVILIVTILQGIGVVGIGLLMLIATGVMAGLFSVPGLVVGTVVTVAVMSTLIFSIINLVLMVASISGLKHKQKKGWKLLFLVLLINAVSIILGFIWRGELSAFLVNAIFLVFLGYFLFAVRDHFKIKLAKTVKTPKVATKS